MSSTIRCDIVSAEAEIFHGEAELVVAALVGVEDSLLRPLLGQGPNALNRVCANLDSRVVDRLPKRRDSRVPHLLRELAGHPEDDESLQSRGRRSAHSRAGVVRCQAGECLGNVSLF